MTPKNSFESQDNMFSVFWSLFMGDIAATMAAKQVYVAVNINAFFSLM